MIVITNSDPRTLVRAKRKMQPWRSIQQIEQALGDAALGAASPLCCNNYLIISLNLHQT